jgi:hypothetical protein
MSYSLIISFAFARFFQDNERRRSRRQNFISKMERFIETLNKSEKHLLQTKEAILLLRQAIKLCYPTAQRRFISFPQMQTAHATVYFPPNESDVEDPDFEFAPVP